MKIIHILLGTPKQHAPNGIITYIYELCQYQKTSGFDTEVWSFVKKGKSIETSLIGNSVINKKFSKNKFRFILDKRIINEINKLNSNSLIHIHGCYIPENYLICKLAIEKGFPYVLTPHGSMRKEANKKSYIKKLIYRYLFEYYIFNHAKIIHVFSKKELEDFEYYKEKKDKIYSIPFGMDIDRFSKLKIINIFKDIIPNENLKKKILFFGRLDFYGKGIDLLLKGFSDAYLKSNNKNWILIFVGPEFKGKYKMKGTKNKIIELSKKLNIYENIYIFDEVYNDDKYNYLYFSDLFVLTSRNEGGMPAALWEAMACKLPCLITDSVGINDIVENNNNCIITKNDVESISKSFSKIFSFDDNQLNIIGTNAFNLIKNKYNLSNHCKDLFTLYKSIYK